MNISTLETLVIEWAEARNLIEGSDPKSQFCKLVSEVGELGDNIGKNRIEATKDDVGDCLVVLIILAQQMGYELSEALSVAYNDIKDRKGKMVNGVFIKESDVG